jgi:hypothetical protein
MKGNMVILPNRYRSSTPAGADWLWLGLIVGLILLALALWLAGLTHPVSALITASEMEPAQGHSFRAALKDRVGWPWALVGDQADKPPLSDLRVLEDGRTLSPARAWHAEIMERGAGAFSHWRSHVFFSSSDNSDPRTNSRSYSFTATARIQPSIIHGVIYMGYAFIAIALMGLAIRFRQRALISLRCRAARLWQRRWDYALAAAFPTFAFGVTVLALPPVWNNSDSVIWLIWQWEQFPHHALLYPAFMAAASSLFPDSPAILSFAITVQQILSILGVAYLASAYQERWQILTMSVLASLGIGLGIYALGLLTEALALPFLLILIGSLLRIRRDGLTAAVSIALFVGLLGGMLTRHAFVVFAVIPIAYTFTRALLKKGRAPLRWNAIVATLGLVIAVIVTARVLTQTTCLLLDQSCVSISGRAGVYRMVDAYALVPQEQKAAWLDSLVQAAQDQEVKRAMVLMAQSQSPWVGSMEAITADPALAHADPDILMNDAFWIFAFSLDPFALKQWGVELLKAVLGPAGDAPYFQGQYGKLLRGSAATVSDISRNNERWILDAVEGTGAEHPESAERYLDLAEMPLTRIFDTLLPLEPLSRGLLLAVSLLLMLSAARSQKDQDLAALLASLWLGYAAYAFALTFATVVLARYLSPLDLLIWLSNAIAIVALIEWACRTRRSSRLGDRRHPHTAREKDGRPFQTSSKVEPQPRA